MRTPDGRNEKIVFYANHPELNVSNSRDHNLSVLVQYKGAEKRLYTGLQVARDPGVWIVWLGCALMVAGIYGAFLVSHRRVWIRIQHGSVVMGGNASKNQASFDHFYEGLVKNVKQSIATEDK
jgi:cytochrome c biogenesis protein